MAEKSTGRVTNGRQPGCQLTVAVLHGEWVNENNRKRGEMEEDGKTERRAGLLQIPQNPAKRGFTKEAGQIQNSKYNMFD